MEIDGRRYDVGMYQSLWKTGESRNHGGQVFAGWQPPDDPDAYFAMKERLAEVQEAAEEIKGQIDELVWQCESQVQAMGPRARWEGEFQLPKTITFGFAQMPSRDPAVIGVTEDGSIIRNEGGEYVVIPPDAPE